MHTATRTYGSGSKTTGRKPGGVVWTFLWGSPEQLRNIRFFYLSYKKNFVGKKFTTHSNTVVQCLFEQDQSYDVIHAVGLLLDFQ